MQAAGKGITLLHEGFMRSEGGAAFPATSL
jgi:hypothetical protein